MKRAFTWTLCFLLIQAILCADASAIQPGLDNQSVPAMPRHVAAVRRVVEKVGSGSDVLVAARLRDKSVVAGYLAASGPTSFSIADPETGAARTIDYGQVDRLSAYNLVTGVQVQQGDGIRAKLARLAAVVLPTRRVTGNHLLGTTTWLLIGIILGVLIVVAVTR